MGQVESEIKEGIQVVVENSLFCLLSHDSTDWFLLWTQTDDNPYLKQMIEKGVLKSKEDLPSLALIEFKLAMNLREDSSPIA